MNNPTLLICSCLNVFAPSKISNIEVRREQYINSLIYSINNYQIKKIIVVENTNSSWVSEDIKELARMKGITLHELLFQADINKTQQHSIGYAHFEMVNHAFTSNDLLDESDSLLIMDGRYIIKNLNYILAHLNDEDCAFIPEVHRLRKNNLCDLRLYMVTKHVFLKYIWIKRHHLSLEKSGWAESILDFILKQRIFKYSSFVTLPRIIGFQGSTGASWDGNSFLKYHIKRLLVTWLGLLKY